jgi:hypothetical protein
MASVTIRLGGLSVQVWEVLCPVVILTHLLSNLYGIEVTQYTLPPPWMWWCLHRADRPSDWYQGCGISAAHSYWPSRHVSCDTSRHRYPLYQISYIRRIIREVTEICNNINRGEGFYLSKSWKSRSFPWRHVGGLPFRFSWWGSPCH